MQTETAQHTPGPWKMGDRGNIYVSLDHRPWSKRIAEIIGDSETAQANARLIAAAPDLLAALEAIDGLAHCAANGGLKLAGQADTVGNLKQQLRAARDLARVAIAKARGA